MDLLNRLIADILSVTETLTKTDAVDLQAYQPASSNSLEKKHGSQGLVHEHKHLARRPMSEGVHRSVC